MPIQRKGGSKKKEATVKPVAPSPTPTRPQSSEDDWNDGFGDAPTTVQPGVKAVEQEMSGPDFEGRSWKIAAGMVNDFRPVPNFMWPIVHSVFGRAGKIGEPDPMTFSSVGPLLVRGAQDRTLAQLPQRADIEPKNLTQSIQAMGADVSAALCFVHAVCRRISTVVNERVSRPILDDALLRTHIGYFVGMLADGIGAGRGMLAGFAGRCGLAVQIAAGDIPQAQRALAGMASGQDMSEVSNTVYGCDPLEVAALSLISGGCCREIAFGISSYSGRRKDVVPGTEQYRWLALFTVIEHTRMGASEKIAPEFWEALGYDNAKMQELTDEVVSAQRRGHGWQWMTQTQLVSAAELLEPIKDPEEIRKARTPSDLLAGKRDGD